MPKSPAENVRMKHAYQRFLRQAKGQSEPSIDKALAAIDRFEADTGYRSFKRFHVASATAFKERLRERVNPRTEKPLSAQTITHTLGALKAFVLWLADQPGFRSRIKYADADYFNPTEREKALASAPRETRAPTLKQVHHLISCMPTETVFDRRDRAVVAFAALTGARDNAIASFRLKHLDLASCELRQAGDEVRTKFSKTYPTWFFPVGEDVQKIVTDWIDELQQRHLFGPDDPIFPKTILGHDAGRRFVPTALDRRGWSTASPVRQIFQKACEKAGLPYFKPHSFRRMLVQLSTTICRTPEEVKAWSQNLGHEDVMTTFRSYGSVEPRRQADLMRRLRQPMETEQDLVAQIRAMIDGIER